MYSNKDVCPWICIQQKFIMITAIHTFYVVMHLYLEVLMCMLGIYD